MIYPNVRYALLASGILLLDRMSKYAALMLLMQPINVIDFFELQLVVNRGISWGFFNTTHVVSGALVRLCIIALIVLLCAYIHTRYKQQKSIYAEVAILSGAVSNLLDRFIYGGVIDFIHLHCGAFSWPIFNIADVAIVCGVIWMIFHADVYE